MRDWHYIIVELLAVRYRELDHMGEFKNMNFGAMCKEKISEYTEMNEIKLQKFEERTL